MMMLTNRAMEALLMAVGLIYMNACCGVVLCVLAAVGNDGCVLIKGCPVPEHRGFEVTLFSNPCSLLATTRSRFEIHGSTSVRCVLRFLRRRRVGQ